MIFLGEGFGIVLNDEHFTPENLSTPADLIAFVTQERRR
jgi:acyl carrier protein